MLCVLLLLGTSYDQYKIASHVIDQLIYLLWRSYRDKPS